MKTLPAQLCLTRFSRWLSTLLCPAVCSGTLALVGFMLLTCVCWSTQGSTGRDGRGRKARELGVDSRLPSLGPQAGSCLWQSPSTRLLHSFSRVLLTAPYSQLFRSRGDITLHPADLGPSLSFPRSCPHLLSAVPLPKFLNCLPLSIHRFPRWDLY